MFIFLNIAIFIVILFCIRILTPRFNGISMLVLIGLALGTLFGLALQLSYGPKSAVITESLKWINIVGTGYIALLQMIVMPLIFTSILSAVGKFSSFSILGKIGGTIVGILLLTVAISALIGSFVVQAFHLTAEGLLTITQTEPLTDNLATKAATIEHFHAADFILSLIPKNIFLSLTGAHPTSVTEVVIFSLFLGLAAVLVKKEDAEKGRYIDFAIEIIQLWITILTRMVIRLAPYGICALIIRIAASSQISEIAKLVDFLILSYIAIALMFCVHAMLLWLVGINPFAFFKKIMPVLIFAFTSRSSSATIPLSMETQTKALKTSPAVASLAASFGSTIGQNGCAGIYPAMLATMTAPVLGIEVASLQWVAIMIFIVTISSIGVAGVGGGATFAALIVLPNLGLPLTLVVILIAIEPLIDMGRTALNVSGSIVAGTITDKFFAQKISKETLANKDCPL